MLGVTATVRGLAFHSLMHSIVLESVADLFHCDSEIVKHWIVNFRVPLSFRYPPKSLRVASSSRGPGRAPCSRSELLSSALFMAAHLPS